MAGEQRDRSHHQPPAPSRSRFTTGCGLVGSRTRRGNSAPLPDGDTQMGKSVRFAVEPSYPIFPNSTAYLRAGQYWAVPLSERRLFLA
jgi:hypothetical protein